MKFYTYWAAWFCLSWLGAVAVAEPPRSPASKPVNERAVGADAVEDEFDLLEDLAREQKPATLVGQWLLGGQTGRTITFAEEGNFCINDASGAKLLGGTYELESNELELLTDGTNVRSRYKFQWVGRNTWKLTNQAGRITRLVRPPVAPGTAVAPNRGVAATQPDRQPRSSVDEVTDQGRGDVGGGPEVPLRRVPDPLEGTNPTHRLIPRDVPEAGKSFRDPCFGTKLTRVTQEPGLRHEYARYWPFNKDQSLILLVKPSSYDLRVYRTDSAPYDTKENLVRTLDFEQPRWDPNDPCLIWGFDEFQIRTVNVRSGETNVVKDFSKDPTIGPILKADPDLYRITTRDEGESSVDMRYWALLLQGHKDDYRLRYLFTWDRQVNRVLGVYKISEEERDVDCVGMSFLGNWVWIGGDEGNGGQLDGLVLANRELTQFHTLHPAGAHSDVGLDVNGREVIVMQNSRTDYIDMLYLDPTTKPVTEPEEYEGSNRVPLVRLYYADDSPAGFHAGVHISCNMPGYCVVSTYLEAKFKEQNWLDRSIILIRLDPRKPEAWYLAKVHNTTGAYWEETHATIANDGSKVVWASNWSQDVGQERAFLMQLDMPENWQARLGR